MADLDTVQPVNDQSPERLARNVSADALAQIERLAGKIAAVALWSCLAGFLLGAGCATVLTLAYLGASR
jgi:hypothetical protein